MEFDKGNPNLVRVQNRNASLAIIPAVSTAVVAWLVCAAALAVLVRREQRLPVASLR